MAQAEYGAKNCRGAASEAVADTMIVYLRAPVWENSLTCTHTLTHTYTHSVQQAPASQDDDQADCSCLNVLRVAAV